MEEQCIAPLEAQFRYVHPNMPFMHVVATSRNLNHLKIKAQNADKVCLDAHLIFHRRRRQGSMISILQRDCVFPKSGINSPAAAAAAGFSVHKSVDFYWQSWRILSIPQEVFGPLYTQGASVP